ncbi:MAG: hypothetical protein NTU81_01390 [Candidatus Nomurabacteria bacterium]|nr:hypothetical protein [Candidatus Nomurabacteria bacterium]
MINNQKDIQKTSLNTYGHSDVSDIKSLSNIHVSHFANKKTEKLVTALYLVSDCMDTDDALKGKLRLLGVELLSDIYKLSTLSPVEKHSYISVSLTHIYELLSFIEIAHTIGFISEMNTSILKKEFSILASDLKSSQEKDKHFTFKLDDKMFHLPEENESEISLGNVDSFNHNKEQFSNNKGTSLDGMSLTNRKSPLSLSYPQKIKSYETNLSDRNDRTAKILSMIKDKKGIQIGEEGISIKDISLAFTNCSEKTIQRELNTLISKGHIKKTGAKRWSRYSIITN